MLTLLENTTFPNYYLSRSSAKSSLSKHSNGTNAEKLDNLTLESKNILFKFQTAFPFDIFPDKIIIDENKVNIVSKDFFFNYHVRSIVIEDITDVSVDTGVFFADLTIVDSSNYRFPITETIRYISKENAFKARKLIQGLILAKSNNINLGSIPISKVTDELCALGECQDKPLSKS